MSPCGSPADRSEPGGPDPFSSEAAVVGTDIRGERINGAPRGALGVLIGVARPGNRRCVSAAAAATRRHSSSQAAKQPRLRFAERLLLPPYIPYIPYIPLYSDECSLESSTLANRQDTRVSFFLPPAVVIASATSLPFVRIVRVSVRDGLAVNAVRF